MSRPTLRLAAVAALSAAVLLAGGAFALAQDPREPPGEVEEVEDLEVVEVVEPNGAGAGAPEAAARSTGLAELAGRTHPLLVHLPIGFLLLLLLLDVAGLALGRDAFRAVGPWVGGLTVLSFVPAAVSGLLRYAYPPYDRVYDGLVYAHRNVMLVTAALMAVAFALRLSRRNRLAGAWKAAYLVLLVGAVALLTYGGHLGGKLVFGEDYLPF